MIRAVPFQPGFDPHVPKLFAEAQKQTRLFWATLIRGDRLARRCGGCARGRDPALALGTGEC